MRRGQLAVVAAIAAAGLGLSGCGSGTSALGLSGDLPLAGVVAAVAAPGFDEDPPVVDEDADPDTVTGEEVDLAPVPQNVKALQPELGPVSGGTLVTQEVDARVVDAEKPAILYRMQVLYR